MIHYDDESIIICGFNGFAHNVLPQTNEHIYYHNESSLWNLHLWCQKYGYTEVTFSLFGTLQPVSLELYNLMKRFCCHYIDNSSLSAVPKCYTLANKCAWVPLLSEKAPTKPNNWVPISVCTYVSYKKLPHMIVKLFKHVVPDLSRQPLVFSIPKRLSTIQRGL